MNTVMIILNGIHLPYHVIHYAIDKAKQNTAKISVLFLSGKTDRTKGYGFPSDLTSVESAIYNENVEGSDKEIINDNMRLVKQMVELENIEYTSTLKTNASINEITQIVSTADLIIVDEDFDNYTLLSDQKISLNKLKQNIIKPIDIVKPK
jgi:uncharacterized surface protein with fasciclin (FAS1) repeats